MQVSVGVAEGGCDTAACLSILGLQWILALISGTLQLVSSNWMFQVLSHISTHVGRCTMWFGTRFFSS